MKEFVLNELLLVSFREKSARRIEFDRKLTVIKGANDTGKSSIIKTIYRTFGATPPQIHNAWESAGIVSAARFSVDNQRFTILRDGSTFTVFDENDQLIKRFESVTKGLGPWFANLFNFHLPLSSRDSETQATPAFLFLPFYIDQDAGWSKNWNSFIRLQQFANWRGDVAGFHIGLRPSEYYVAKSKLSSINQQIESLKGRRELTHALLQRVENELNVAQFNIDLDEYKKEVKQLIDDCNQIRAKEDKLRREMTEALNQQYNVESQIGITRKAAEELDKDLKYATEILDRCVDCPTCGASYENSFAERFEMAQDEDTCRELLRELESELNDVKSRLKKIEKKSAPLKVELKALSSILQKRRGKVRLQNLIENEGRKEVRRFLEKDILTFNESIGSLEVSADELRKEMNGFDKRKRQNEIKQHYRSLMKKFLRQLNVLKLEEKTYAKVASNISESGSDLTRALLAYYFAFLQTVRKYSSSTFCPIVIDSPRQQDQDKINYKKILQFLLEYQPENSQMIVGLVESGDVKMPGKLLYLRKKHKALIEDDYDSVASEIRRMMDAQTEGATLLGNGTDLLIHLDIRGNLETLAELRETILAKCSLEDLANISIGEPVRPAKDLLATRPFRQEEVLELTVEIAGGVSVSRLHSIVLSVLQIYENQNRIEVTEKK